jgi:predicted ATPase
MALRTLEIKGLRGFASAQRLDFAIPTGSFGSGLSVLVGANNTGKSTVIEALRALAQNEPPSFTQGRRNQAAGDSISLRVEDADGGIREVNSVRAGSSETQWAQHPRVAAVGNMLVLPSRRTFSPYFGKSDADRAQYMSQMGFPAIRVSEVGNFSYRLFRAQKNQAAFNTVLAKVLNPVPDWTIDQHDTGQYFLKMGTGNAFHSSEGLGEGLVSLFFIVDALYDSNPGETIVIDEPELSLHPAFQRRLSSLINTYAADRQIILATHSPYFVNLRALENGATICRAHLQNGQSTLSQLGADAAKAVVGLLADVNNPHVLGLNAQEVFFLEDTVILVEGQEDVLFYERVQDDLKLALRGNFFGWGVGGADKMKHIAKILSDLGFEKVVGILDANKANLIKDLKKDFPEYVFLAIPADDVRTKTAAPARLAGTGLLDDKNEHVRPEHEAATRQIFEEINTFLAPPAVV